MRSAQMNHSLPLGSALSVNACIHLPVNRRHHFFEFTSLSIATSNIVSANNFFSLPFSASNARNRAASEGSTLSHSKE